MLKPWASRPTAISARIKIHSPATAVTAGRGIARGSSRNRNRFELTMRHILRLEPDDSGRWLGSELPDPVRPDMLGLLPVVHPAELPPDGAQRGKAQNPLVGQIRDNQPQR